jgi:hypothetical protein
LGPLLEDASGLCSVAVGSGTIWTSFSSRMDGRAYMAVMLVDVVVVNDGANFSSKMLNFLCKRVIKKSMNFIWTIKFATNTQMEYIWYETYKEFLIIFHFIFSSNSKVNNINS